MKIHAWKWAVVVLGVLVISGCGTIEDRNFPAVQQGTKTQARNDRAGACVGLDQWVPPPPTTHEAGEVLVGYENHLERGADPFPCNHRDNYAHQALVKFDLSALPAGSVLTAATLEADVRFVPLMPVTETSRDCRNLFQTATEAWADGDFRGPVTDPRTHVAAEGSGTWTTASGRLSLNVLTQVRRWANGTQPNQGFSFSPPPAHSFAEETLSCVAAFRNWNLHIKRFVPDPARP